MHFPIKFQQNTQFYGENIKQRVLLRLCTPLLLKTNKDKKLFILVGKVPKQKYGNSSPFSLVSSSLVYVDNIVSLSQEVLVKNANPPPPANLEIKLEQDLRATKLDCDQGSLTKRIMLYSTGIAVNTVDTRMKTKTPVRRLSSARSATRNDLAMA